MKRPARKEPKVVAACLLVAALFVTTVTGGVCLCRGHAPGADGKIYIVNFDVCGAGTASVAVQGMDSMSVAASPDEFYLPYISHIPPTPDEVVASAEPGDLDKPPEA